jgi:hypothetical protein
LRAVELCFVEMRVIIFHQTIPINENAVKQVLLGDAPTSGAFS